ncbi:hypothetical protein QCA50_008484 [Cerrena zonata]|uniref:F-box domain-containing protein n=1 Tax=Cerrena zonata TaxID=2478898 RepID=A0AAW0G9R4_9APHY
MSTSIVLPSPIQDGLTLPPEMTDYIIDFLHEDKSSLRSCSLVASTFVTSSQLHLFRTLSFIGRAPTGFTYIVPFFRKHPHLKSHVQDIHIVGDEQKPDGKTNGICICVIANILSTFPYLRVFTISYVCLRYNKCCSSLQTQPFLPIDITRLGLKAIDDELANPGCPYVITLLRLFKSIQSLHVVDVWPLVDTETPLDWGPPLSRLTLTGRDLGVIPPFAHILTAHNMLGDLKQLKIACGDWGESDDAAAIIKASAKSIIHLTLDVASLIWSVVHAESRDSDAILVTDILTNSNRWKFLGLSSCHSLKSIEISIILVSRWGAYTGGAAIRNVLGPRSFQYMLNLLSEIPNSVEEITIFFRLTRSQHMDAISQDLDWDGLARLIFSFPEIKIANLILSSDSNAFKGVAVSCQEIVQAALRSSTREREGVIRVSIQYGDYKELVQYWR